MNIIIKKTPRKNKQTAKTDQNLIKSVKVLAFPANCSAELNQLPLPSLIFTSQYIGRLEVVQTLFLSFIFFYLFLSFFIFFYLLQFQLCEVFTNLWMHKMEYYLLTAINRVSTIFLHIFFVFQYMCTSSLCFNICAHFLCILYVHIFFVFQYMCTSSLCFNICVSIFVFLYFQVSLNTLY